MFLCWVPSHCAIGGEWDSGPASKGDLDHDIDPLRTVHFTDLKPLVNSYIQQEFQIKWDVSIHGRYLYLLKPTLGPPKRFRHLVRAEEVVITRLTPNWPYQGHKITYLVPRTTNCLPALWPDSDNWAHTPGMYSVATKSWWVLHSWLIEDLLWDACIIEFLREAGFYYLIWMAIYPIQLFIQISHSDNWPYAPGVWSVTGKSWRILHS